MGCAWLTPSGSCDRISSPTGPTDLTSAEDSRRGDEGQEDETCGEPDKAESLLERHGCDQAKK
jgi:hypothetical protein